jgi:hypothetical protein
MSNYFLHKHRAVAFIDVLGFKGKLKEYETEAINHYNEYSDDDSEYDEDLLKKYYSKGANEFILTLEESLKILNKEVFRYYLFSDNICITTVNETTKENMFDLLNVISNLYYEFARKDHFLRGGIDYGLFVDRESIALGLPLMNAYNLENKVAVFPRIVLSNEFVKQFESFVDEEKLELEKSVIQDYIYKSCEIFYLNVFSQIKRIDDHIPYLTEFAEIIQKNLKVNSLNEQVYLKFEWLADEFNQFIDRYTKIDAYLDEDNIPDDNYISSINQLKISYVN